MGKWVWILAALAAIWYFFIRSGSTGLGGITAALGAPVSNAGQGRISGNVASEGSFYAASVPGAYGTDVTGANGVTSNFPTPTLSVMDGPSSNLSRPVGRFTL